MSQLQQLRKGSTSLLLLNTLADGTKYGYQIMRELETRSEGYFTMTAALLYPALHKLEKQGYVESEWQQAKGERRRKYYTITDAGRNALVKDKEDWKYFVDKLFATMQSSAQSSAPFSAEPNGGTA